MKILLTGAGGFIGRTVVAKLIDLGDVHVVGLDQSLQHLPKRRGLTTVEADLADRQVVANLFDGSIDAVVHLAAVPGGAAEDNPAGSQQINIDATLDLIGLAADQGNSPRFVFSSSIAVFGDPLPAGGVDDDTPLRPRMIYGMHKRMIEIAVATMSRRGGIDGVTLRLPGIVARPLGPSGMKSAFMSDIFHRLRAGQAYTLPVSREAQLWLMSATQCAENLARAVSLDSSALPENRVVTLPALRVSMAALVAQIAETTGSDSDIVGYDPDPQLEAGFGAHPKLETPAAERVGLAHDGSIDALVNNALSAIDDG